MNEKIKFVSQLDTVSMQYRVGFDPGEAVKWAELPREFCCCPTLAEMIASVNDLIPRMSHPTANGIPNPNNGNPHHKWSIGREYSRVLYLRIVKRENYIPPGFDWVEFETMMEMAGEEHGADEMIVMKNDEGEFCYRWWWD